MNSRHLTTAIVAVLAVAGFSACGGPDDSSSVTAEVSDDATLCGVYTDEYRAILDSPTPFGEAGWDEEAQELLQLARVLEQLAPVEQADNAEANVGYFQALADVESAGEFVEGSNTFNLYLIEECPT